MDNPEEISRSIESSFELHRNSPQSEPQTATKKRKADRWDIEAQDFIQRNPSWDSHDPIRVADLTQFLNENSGSVLALRSDYSVKFLDILEKVCDPIDRFPCKGSQYFHRCRLRAVILNRMKKGSTRRTFVGCHIGRNSILIPSTSATSKFPPVSLTRAPTVEEDHRNPWRAVMEMCGVLDVGNPVRELLMSQSRL